MPPLLQLIRARRRRPGRGLALGTLAALFAAGCGGAPPDAGPPNVVLFVLDAARADHFGAYGYARDTTPHVDAFAREALRFEQAVSESAYTFASTAALLTGLPTARSGLLAPRPIAAAQEMLAEVAGRNGYRTVAYSENPFVAPQFGFDAGFDAFEAVDPWAEGDARSVVDSEAAIDRTLARAVGEGERPFFAYLHVLRPHNPYAPPEGFAGRFGSVPSARRLGTTWSLTRLDQAAEPVAGARLEQIVALYDENLAYGDALFGRLLEGLRERGLLERTVVALASDHGEAFGEHGRMLHSTTVFDEMIRIPLLLRVPGAPPGVSAAPVQLADLGAARAPTVSWTIPTASTAAVRTPRRKLHVEILGDDTRYFDLERDPGEHESLPLDGEAEPLLATWRGAARALEAARGSAGPAAPMDPAARKRLEALGYTLD